MKGKKPAQKGGKAKRVKPTAKPKQEPLPKPTKGRDLSEADKFLLADKVCTLYAAGDHTLMEALKANGIGSDNTWYAWCHKHPEIREKYDDAIAEMAQRHFDKITAAGLKSLLRRVEGEEVTETVEEWYTPKPTTKDPEPKPRLARKVITTRTVLPSDSLIKYAVDNIPGRAQPQEQVEVEQNGGTVKVTVIRSPEQVKK